VLARIVADKLQLQWSLEQVAGWLKRTYPDDTSRQVSHETIYRSLFIQARGALKKELVEHLRRTRVMRRSRHHTMKTDKHGRITTPSRSASVLPALKTVRYPVTGKVIFCLAAKIARSQHLSSVNLAT